MVREAPITSSLLKKIQIARRYMCEHYDWNADKWYGFLSEKTGKESTTKLNMFDATYFMDQLKKVGFIDTYRKPQKTEPRNNTLNATNKALWRELGNMGVLNNKSLHGLSQYIYRVIGRVDSVDNLNQDEAQKLHKQLRNWYNREKGKREKENARV